jgi:hypothetical protein
LALVLLGGLLCGCGAIRIPAGQVLRDLPQPESPYIGSFLYDPWTVAAMDDRRLTLRYRYGDGAVVKSIRYELLVDEVDCPPWLAPDTVIEVAEITGSPGLRIRPTASHHDQGGARLIP